LDNLDACPGNLLASFIRQRQQNPKRFRAEWQMKSQSLQSGPAKGPLIATFAIDWSTAAPRTTGDQRRNPHGRLPKIRAAPGRNPHPPHFQEWSNS
jgi:hypothetical protein